VDPLSDVLSLLKLQTYVAGGFPVGEATRLEFPRHQGLKCYALVSGACWLAVEGVAEAVLMEAGDCVVLPRGRPFCLATDLSSPGVNFNPDMAVRTSESTAGCFVLGGHFLMTGNHGDMLLDALPSIAHIRTESNKAAMRWSLECLRDELGSPQPGGSLVAQQLAYIMLVQALRLHLQEEAARGVGWLFALADPRLRTAMTCIHDEPEHPWTIQELAERAGMSRTVFAQRFKQRVGSTSMEYLTRWRMLLAGDRLKASDDPVSRIAWSVGYETESAFGKAFKRVLGCSPREHRRRGAASLMV
jgi:AraC-like DNA-binding protein